MVETFADVLVGTIKTLQNKVETIEKEEKDQKLLVKKLQKDVANIQKGMDLVLEHLKSAGD
ncbi:MAG: hypothetical protein PVI03_04640 [Candidatus Thorarchaeota archaeon]|jgi:hypothetical protein